jgi:hypothetical protein
MPEVAVAGASPHVPWGWHPDDEAPVYAPLGALTATDGGARVVCHGCGALLQLLSRDHLRRHGWTPEEYRLRFGLPAKSPLLSADVRRQRQAEAARRHDVGGALAPHATARAVVNAASAAADRLGRAREYGHETLQDYLREAYAARRLTVQEISRELRCSTRTTRSELARAGVIVRPARQKAIPRAG